MKNGIGENNIEERIKVFGELAENKYGVPANSNFKYPKRTWPDKDITKAPTWCSVDLRDGNQALINPMNIEKKLEYFNLLVQMGFKEIEVGFPASGGPDYEFIRYLIDKNLIPDNVKIQVLTQCREDLIETTRKCLEGAKNVIIHLYNSTSTTQREIVFKKTKNEIIKLAENGIDWIKEKFNNFEGNLQLEYSPESFTGTEVRYAKEICQKVIKKWDNFGGNDIIINLPATVENSTPDRYADKIEYMKDELNIFIKKIKNKVGIIISIHTHNDRGTSVAATELAIKAGADRVEGVIGVPNGERSGNVDIVTVGLNMFSQGVSPKLDLSNIGKVSERISQIINIDVPVRYPYTGEYTHTALSGSHQDAISKGLRNQQEKLQYGDTTWDVPYLPIDPEDIGLKYEPIRYNSQSGKGGLNFILEKQGYKIPKKYHAYIGKIFQNFAEEQKGEMTQDEIREKFESIFVNDNYGIINIDEIDFSKIRELSQIKKIGWINAVSDYISETYKLDFKILDYNQYAQGPGREANAITYFEIEINGETLIGFGKDVDFEKSAIKGLISTINIGMNNLKS